MAGDEPETGNGSGADGPAKGAQPDHKSGPREILEGLESALPVLPTDNQPELGPNSAFHKRALHALNSRYTRKALRYVIYGALGVSVLLVLMVLVANSPIGKRFIADRIAAYAPENGLHFTVGRIEGNLLSEATMHDVVAYDPQGGFLKVSKATVKWQPMRWFVTGIDIERLAFDNGVLLRVPVLKETQNQDPLLPEFEIRVRDLQLNNIRLAPTLVNGLDQRLDARGRLLSREGHLLVRARANIGDKDFVYVNVDSEPDINKLELAGYYNAPKDGAIAQIFGIRDGYVGSITGKGKYSHWDGALTVERNTLPFAAIKIDKRNDVWSAVGQIYPADVVTGTPGRLLGNTVSLAAKGTLKDRILRGSAAIRGRGISGEGGGAIDFGQNLVQQSQLTVRLTDPLSFGDTVWISGGTAAVSVSGPFDDLNVRHRIYIPDMKAGVARLSEINQQGLLNYDGQRWTIPVDVNVGRVITGQELVDPRLRQGRARGTIFVDGSRISSTPIAIAFPDARGLLTLNGDYVNGGYRLAGPVAVNNFYVGDVGGTKVGRVNGGGNIVVTFGTRRPWSLEATGKAASNDIVVPNVGRVGGNANFVARMGSNRPWSVDARGRATSSNIVVTNVGTARGSANFVASLGANRPWSVRASVDGRIPRVENSTFANIAGSAIAFKGDVSGGKNRAIIFRNVGIGAPKLKMSLNGQYYNGVTELKGSGSQTQYGPFQVVGTYSKAGPRAKLIFASPYPPLKLANVTVDIAPIKDGFSIDTNGGSRLGDFNGHLEYFSSANGPTILDIQQFKVWKTEIVGKLRLEDSLATGRLAVNGGGVNGDIGLVPRNGGQGFDVSLLARNATFGGENPLYVNRARINGSGDLVEGRSTIKGNVLAKGVGQGSLFIGELAANVDLVDGVGKVTAAIDGQRGSLYAMQLQADVSPDRIAGLARGLFAGKRIHMPRRAVLTKQSDGSWKLDRSQVNYGDGFVIGDGRFGGEYGTAVNMKLSHMPLSLADLFFNGLGLGGDISGEIDYLAPKGALPSGNAKVKVYGLTRSGLVLTSTPVDLSMIAKLSGSQVETRAVVYDKNNSLGRVQAQITNMPATGSLVERINAGALFGQLRYKGPAEALWRLAALDAIDMTGPLSAAGNIRGTLTNPTLQGTVYSDNLRVRSALSGTDVRNTTLRGRFKGSRLVVTTASGTTPNGGTVRGTGWIDVAQVQSSGRLPSLDFKFSARNALLLDTATMQGVVTGPLRVKSDGNSGVLAGRLYINSGKWQLGRADQQEKLPQIRTTEVNAPPDLRPARRPFKPWRYLIDASGPSRLDVEGLGLESEWGANINLRGTTDDPRIGGEARVVRGVYSFSGNDFDVTRGRIYFDVGAPIDPRLDIVAETKAKNIQVQARVQGTALQPEISFTSSPPLPEDEIMSQLLFGGSVAELTPTDAVQLASTMASLRGGRGLNPINRLRSAIGLDRLRILSADPSVGRGTSIAVGKNIGRRAYGEIITDGQGYSATELEYRITNWLALLATISTVGRDSVTLEVSRDY